jgi:hypothetical protein
VNVVDEIAGAVGWLEEERLQRTSHALAAGGRVWLVDVIDDESLEERVRALGEPAAVVQLLDRHNRDCAAVARRLGVPHHVVPRELPGTPFQLIPIMQARWWHEVALWWEGSRILVVADALGTIPFFRAGSEPAGVHPLLRLVRVPRALAGLAVEHLFVGHGAGIHGEAAGPAVEEAIRTARRAIPRWLAGVPRIVRSGY